MILILLIAAAASLALVLRCAFLASGYCEIRDGQDWEVKQHEIDVHIFRALLDPEEERYLQRSLSHREFESFQRKRIGLALRMLRLAKENADMLMKLGHLAKVKGDPALTDSADALIVTAIRFRFNLLPALVRLRLKWLFPSWNISLPEFEARYQHVCNSIASAQKRGGRALT